jgi:acyl dehydratase
MLYALACGFAQNDQQAGEVDFVYEGRALKTVPSMAGNLLDHRFLAKCGWDVHRVQQAEQKLQLYRPLPVAAELRADRRVVAVLDHGKTAGASIMVESEVRMAKDDTVLFTLATTLSARGDGGFGGPEGSLPLPHKMPHREPDLVCELRSRSDQALLFRLTGDRSPQYADPEYAARFGFAAAPLHEQCVSGIACRAVLRTICDYDFTLISGFDLRFGTPLYPGEVVTTEMWQDRNIVSFRCLVKNRDAVVIDSGKCTLSA